MWSGLIIETLSPFKNIHELPSRIRPCYFSVPDNETKSRSPHSISCHYLEFVTMICLGIVRVDYYYFNNTWDFLKPREDAPSPTNTARPAERHPRNNTGHHDEDTTNQIQEMTQERHPRKDGTARKTMIFLGIVRVDYLLNTAQHFYSIFVAMCVCDSSRH